jgi:LPS-assembly protein
MIEPIVQLVVAPKPDDSIPNEDSALVEFDEANLFDLNRFPGADAKEAGLHFNLGANYLLQDASGLSVGLTGGRVFRLDDFGQFSQASGLSGTTSDWLIAASIKTGQGISLNGRTLLDDRLDPTKTEIRLDIDQNAYALSLGYTDLAADPAENRDLDTQEIVLDASYALNGNWTASGNTLYDLVADEAVSTGAGLAFLNECLKVDLSVSRRFTSSSNVNPATDFGLTVELLGFGGGEVGPTRQCRK